MKTFGIGIIGFGFMGRLHAYSVANLPFYYEPMPFRAELRGICSRSDESLARAQEMFAFPYATRDYRELLARDDIDAVSICTPNADHEAMALAAIAARKHVYLEKPVSTDAASARRIALAADEAGVACQTVFNYRFYPSTLRAKQWIDEGNLGRILSFRALYLHSGSVQADKPVGWRLQKDAAGGGVMADLGSHALDLLTWLCGDVRRVVSAQTSLYPQRPLSGGGMTGDLTEDVSVALITLENGALGTLESSKAATGIVDELRMEIHGDKGALRFNLQEPDWLEVFDETRPEQPLGGLRGWHKLQCLQRYEAPGGKTMVKQSIGWNRSHVHSYFSFLDAINGGRLPSPSLADGARIQEIMEAAYRSAERGTWEDARG